MKNITDKIKIGVTLIIAVFLALTAFVQAQNTNDENPKTLDFNNKIFTYQFTIDDFELSSFEDYDIIQLKDGGLLNEIGEPMLPIKNILIALPENTKAAKIKVLEIKEEELPGSFLVMPGYGPQKINLNNDLEISYNSEVYFSNSFYPSNYIQLCQQTDLAGQAIAIVTIYPVHFNPELKKINFIKEIKFEIEGQPGYVYGDYLPSTYSEIKEEQLTQQIKDMVINPEDVFLRKNEERQPFGVGPGDYDYVIITKSSWISALQPLADWKTQKGVPSNIVNTSWIYSNYTGASNKAKIRAFISDAHSTWGSTFFLLGGDTDTIPYHTANYEGDDIPTDTYYSDYDDDWTCEVNVGRASVNGTENSAGGIGNFVNKTLTYERNPPTSNYTKKIALFGFDLDFWTDGEDCKIDIDDLYIHSSWNVTKVYDSHSGNHEDAVDSAVNSGQNLINHIDHSGEYFMGTGWTNHQRGLNTSEVDAFNNGDKQSIWYSIGCWAEAFDYGNCIAEHFVRDTNGGGVGFVGNTRYGWYYVGYDDYASLRYDRYFFRSFFNQNHYKLGDIFSDHKMDAYFSLTQNDLNKYIFTELNLLGDPELPVWQNNPPSFLVNHTDEIQVGSSSFTVHVEDSGGSNVENAYVCLWKGSEVYLTNYTDSSGNFTFNPNPTTIGTMTVTVTKKDYIPYIGIVNVTTGDATPPNIIDEDLTASDPLDTDPLFGWINITCNVTDNVEVDKVLLNITCPDSTFNNASMINMVGTNKYYNETCFSQNGVYNYFICAYDTSGNSYLTENFDFSMPPNWDIDMNGQTFLPDLVQVSIKYGQIGANGWIREDVDNDGQIFLPDLIQVSLHYGETWS